MADMNSCSFTGRLTKDAEVSFVGDKGTLLTKFAMANNTGFGQFVKTNYFNVQLWGKTGEAVAPYLKKGKQIGVTGTLENRKWIDANGVSHDSWTLTASGVTLLADSKKEGPEEYRPDDTEEGDVF